MFHIYTIKKNDQKTAITIKKNQKKYKNNQNKIDNDTN